MPAKHAPEPVSPFIPPVIGSMLDFERDGQHLHRLYITGDTLVHDELREIPLRSPDIDLALVHLGGAQILGGLLTMDAEQGVEALRIVRPQTAIPIHFDDYTVFRSPLEDFMTLVEEQGLETDVLYLDRGESYPLRWPSERKSARTGRLRRSAASAQPDFTDLRPTPNDRAFP